MIRIVAAPLLALAFAFANVGPTLCAAMHAHRQAPVEHAHHGAHPSHAAASAASAGDAWAPAPDPGHHVTCPDPAHCGVTLVGPAQHGAVVTVVVRPLTAPLLPAVDGTARQAPAPATPPPRA
jgi:hypothetical protein